MRKEQDEQEATSGQQPHRVDLPGWLMKEEEVGLGKALKRLTHRLGIQPCQGCEKRAAVLDQWIVFHRR